MKPVVFVLCCASLLAAGIGTCSADPAKRPANYGDWQAYGEKPDERGTGKTFDDLGDHTAKAILDWVNSTCGTNNLSDVQILQLISHCQHQDGSDYNPTYVPTCRIRNPSKDKVPADKMPFKIVSICMNQGKDLPTDLSAALNNWDKQQGAKIIGSINTNEAVKGKN